MAEKVCKTCGNSKDISEFRHRKDNRYKLGFKIESYCKVCERKQQKERSKKRYVKKGKEEFKQFYADKKNREDFLLKNKIYRQKNKDKLKKYREQRIEKDRENQRNWKNKKIKEDVFFKLRLIVSNSIYHYLKRNKKCSMLKKLPYTMKELKEHLEKQFETWMSWDNWGRYKLDEWDDTNQETWKWQIDHIIPHSSFKYKTMDDENFKNCWALENLRPLSAKENLLKRDNII